MGAISQELADAIELHEAGDVARAAETYRRILEQEPGQPDALHLLGVVLYEAGDFQGAERLMRQAIAASGDDPLYHSNLGNVLRAQGRLEDAAAALHEAVRVEPRFAEAHFNLAVLYEDLRRSSEAERCYRRTLEADPDWAAAHNNLGVLLKKQGRLAEAEKHYREAVRLRPQSAGMMCNLARMLEEMGRLDDAVAAYRRALEIQPEDHSVRFMLAGLTGEQPPPNAPPQYVIGVFDDYAERFNHHLVEVLGYRTPRMLRDAVAEVAPGRTFDLLDLGCGTGLVGLEFRDVARRLDGVDFAERMLAKARARKIYDDLRKAEAVATLREARGLYDLVVAADVFIYVGALEEMFEAAAAALPSGGLFAFSVEAHPGSSFVLRPSLRYAHSLEYLDDLARRWGFRRRLTRDVVLRMEYHCPIDGTLLVLERD